MLKKLKILIQIIIFFSLIGILFYFIYYLSYQAFSLFKSVDPKLGAGMIVGSSTVIVSVITILFSKRIEQKVFINNQLREKKIPVYERIIDFIFKLTFAEKLGKNPPSEIEMIIFFADTTKDLVIWGSKDIVDAFGNFREELMNIEETDNASKILSSVEDLLIAIRKDLGHKHFGTKRGDILKLYI